MSSPQAAQLLHSNSIHGRDITLNNNAVTNCSHRISTQPEPMDILKERVAFGALHDSAERFDPPKCHPETRTAVLNLINQWARDSQNGKPILWLSGAAGAGKSAIAQSLVEEWKKDELPTTCFFFWRTSSKRNQKTHLVPTISHQIFNLFPSVKPFLEAAICAGGIFERSLQSQLEELVVKPLKLSEFPTGMPPIIVVIDGLDECCVSLPGQDYEAQQRETLEGIASVCLQLPSLRFFIASRPERQIRESFGEGALHAHTLPISLNNTGNARADIRLFLECKLKEIRQRQPGLGPSWPSQAQISLLVDKSSGQFIYPSTVVKFISRSRQNPKLSLELVLKLKSKPQDQQADYPFWEIDALYMLVLRSIAPSSWPFVKDILGALCYDAAFKSPNPSLKLPSYNYQLGDIFADHPKAHTPAFFQRFVFISIEELHAHLTDVHSVLEIPSQDDLQDSNPIRFMHATLSEFLQDQVRSQKFFIDKEQYNLRNQRLLLTHAIDCFPKDTAAYDSLRLPNVTFRYLIECAPCKEVMVRLWKLMKKDIGSYPNVPGRIRLLYYNPRKDKKQALEELVHPTEATHKLQVLQYLECNIPTIEPSRLRRFLVQRLLTMSYAKYEKERKGTNKVRG